VRWLKGYAKRERQDVSVGDALIGKRLRVQNTAQPSGYVTIRELTVLGLYKRLGHRYLEYRDERTDLASFRIERLSDVVDLQTGETFANLDDWIRSLGVDVDKAFRI